LIHIFIKAEIKKSILIKAKKNTFFKVIYVYQYKILSMIKFYNFLPIIFVIISTVTSQLILKWRVDTLIKRSEDTSDQIQLILKNIFDPYILLCFSLAFVAAISWIFTLTRFNLSSAYPYMALNFLFVIFFK